MEKLITVKRGVQTGVKPDEQFADETIWADARNVTFSDGAVRPIYPQFPFINAIASRPITGAHEIIIGGDRHFFWGTQERLYMLEEGLEHEEVTPGIGAPPPTLFTLNREDLWQFASHKESVLAIANGLPYKYTAGVGEFAAIADFEADSGVASAQLIMTYKVYALVGNTDIDDTGIFWCDTDDLTEWEPKVDNVAGGLYIRDMKSPLQAWLPLGKGVALYGSSQVFMLNYIGSPKVFSWDHLLSGIGAYSKHSVVAVGKKHYGMGSEGIWVTDGFEYKYLDRGSIHRYIFDNFNFDNANLSVAWHDVAETMVCFFWCSAGSETVDSGAGYNYVNNTWSLLSFGRTFGTSKTVFKRSILTDDAGNLWEQQAKGGTATPSPSTPLPVIPEGEALIVDEGGFGNIGFGYGGFGSVWRVGEDG